MMTGLLKNARQGSRKIKSMVPIYGWGGTISRIARNSFWLETFWQLSREINVPDERLDIRIPLKIVRYARDLDLASWRDGSKILKFRGEYGLEQFEFRWHRGDSIFCGYSGDELVGFVWLQLPPVDDVGYRLREDEAYTYDAWTFEAYRGKRILPALLHTTIQYTRSHHPEIRRLISHIATWNQPSVAGFTRAGYCIRKKEIGVSLFGYHKKWVISRRYPQTADTHR